MFMHKKRFHFYKIGHFQSSYRIILFYNNALEAEHEAPQALFSIFSEVP